jgi:hypothetical protein
MQRAPLLLGLALFLLGSGCGGTETTHGKSCKPACGDRLCGDDGCGGSCGSCQPWQTCSAAVCTIDPTSTWDLIAVEGSLSRADPQGDPWDVDGPPDPFVCVTINEVRQCTTAVTNNFSALWNQKLFSRIVARSFEGSVFQGGIEVDLRDQDGTGSEPVCFGAITVGNADFLAGQFTATCDSTTSDATFKLVYAP